MVKGAIHPNGTSFRRVARLDVVSRVRRLYQENLISEKPRWLEWAERVPPMENHNLQLQAKTIRSPYPQMVKFLLDKHPDLRFQDCFVDGNDWSAGADSYRDDHPAMQFVARQLQIMRMEGVGRKEAFRRTEKLFLDRREALEAQQKVMMALAATSDVSKDLDIRPMFSTGAAYLQAEVAKAEEVHLKKILWQLREMKNKKIEEAQKLEERSEEGKELEERSEEGKELKEQAKDAQEVQRSQRPSQRVIEKQQRVLIEKQRQAAEEKVLRAQEEKEKAEAAAREEEELAREEQMEKKRAAELLAKQQEEARLAAERESQGPSPTAVQDEPRSSDAKAPVRSAAPVAGQSEAPFGSTIAYRDTTAEAERKRAEGVAKMIKGPSGGGGGVAGEDGAEFGSQLEPPRKAKRPPSTASASDQDTAEADDEIRKAAAKSAAKGPAGPAKQ